MRVHLITIEYSIVGANSTRIRCTDSGLMHNHSTDYTTTHVHPTSDLTAKGHAHGRCVSDGAEGGGGGGSGTGGGGEGGVGGIGVGGGGCAASAGEGRSSGEVQPEPTRVDRWLDGRPPEGWGDSNSTGRPSAMRTDTRRTDTQRERTGDATLRITRAGRRRSSEGVQPSARPAASRSANEGAARRGDEGTTARRAQGEARRRHARAGGRGARTSAAGSTGRGYHVVLVPSGAPRRTGRCGAHHGLDDAREHDAQHG